MTQRMDCGYAATKQFLHFLCLSFALRWQIRLAGHVQRSEASRLKRPFAKRQMRRLEITVLLMVLLSAARVGLDRRRSFRCVTSKPSDTTFDTTGDLIPADKVTSQDKVISDSSRLESLLYKSSWSAALIPTPLPSGYRPALREWILVYPHYSL